MARRKPELLYGQMTGLSLFGLLVRELSEIEQELAGWPNLVEVKYASRRALQAARELQLRGTQLPLCECRSTCREADTPDGLPEWSPYSS